MKVFAALRDDAHQGWVWLERQDLPPRCIVKITNTGNRRTVYCEALQFDSNFLENYNRPGSRRFPITAPESSIVLGGWFRAGLGGLDTKGFDAPLSIKVANGPLGRFRAGIDHPQNIVRLATWLSSIGLALGVLSLLPMGKAWDFVLSLMPASGQ